MLGVVVLGAPTVVPRATLVAVGEVQRIPSSSHDLARERQGIVAAFDLVIDQTVVGQSVT